ncbi:hypothetical protein GDO81_013653 [Engystomops pustulosus]|uniref:Uncharacterized protein n=1 Tax=Engystomops pustulosus TaxID=76066 RepID=A0AAV7B1W8_ENGPU|nr:hypothetical protein GDO81_013653 [Engystomops pustulosus]
MRLLHPRSQASYIPKIKGPKGKEVFHPDEICGSFSSIYTSLYDIRGTEGPAPLSSQASHIDSYVAETCLPVLKQKSPIL